MARNPEHILGQLSTASRVWARLKAHYPSRDKHVSPLAALRLLWPLPSGWTGAEQTHERLAQIDKANSKEMWIALSNRETDYLGIFVLLEGRYS